MWCCSRGLLRPAVQLAGRQVAGAAATMIGSSRGGRRTAEDIHLTKAAAARFLFSGPTSPGSRWLSNLGSPELQEGAGSEREDAHGGGDGDGQDTHRHPSTDEPESSSDSGPSAFTLHDIVTLLRQENASDICVIQLPPEVNYSNYFIIVSGTSGRHLHAMAQYLLKMYKFTVKRCKSQVVIEGKDCDDWLCIDFGHTVVHFMLPETREVYELEKLWTLRTHDDQLAQMVTESLPDDFILGLTSEVKSLDSVES